MNETDLFQQELLNSLTGDTKLGRLFAQDSGDFPFAVGLAESFKAAAVAALLMKKQQSVLLLTPDAESAARWQENLCALLPKDMSERVLLLPPVELSPFTDFQPEADVVAARLNALAALSKEETVCVVTPAEALLGRFQPKDAFAAERLLLTPGVTIELDELAQRLIELGYQRESMIDTPGTFACRGGIADIYPVGWDRPVRLDFFDNEIETVRYFAPDTQRSAETCLRELELFPCRLQNAGVTLLDYLPEGAYLLVDEAAQCEQNLREAEQERQIYFDGLLDAGSLTGREEPEAPWLDYL